MKILVTGAAGFIGSHLAERLADLGHQVTGVDCLSSYYSKELKLLNIAQIESKGVEFLRLDLAKDSLEQEIQYIEFAYHLAAQPGISDNVSFDEYFQNNIIATHRMVSAAKRFKKFKGFVYISTSSVYGADATGDESSEPKPTSYYGVTKLAAEQLVLSPARDHKFPACSLRLFSVYGPRERPEKLYPVLIDSILKDKNFPLYEGSEHHLRSYTYVNDIVDGMVAVLRDFNKCIGEIFNIGTDTAFTTAEGIRIVERIIGKPAKISVKPKRSGDQVKTRANIKKARKVLGYNPTTTLIQGLEKEVAWYRQCILGKIDLWSRNR